MSQKEFPRRRRKLLRAMGPRTVAVVATSKVQYRNSDTAHPFRPDSDFYYLSGFPEPEAVLVLIPGRPEGETLLFCRERDPEKEQWTGSMIGVAGAKELSLVEESYPISRLDEMMPSLLEERSRIYHTLGRNAELDGRLVGWLNQARRKARAGTEAPSEIVDLDRILHELRLIKDASELKRMRKAARITARAHQRAMRTCRPGMWEYQLEAEILHEFTANQVRSPSYPSIVAAGANACVLHYSDNNCEIQNGDLVLIDAGAEFEYYAADITRTFPANGRFSAPQRELYDLVLKAQLAAIEKVRPGQRWNDPHDAAVAVLTKGMVALGLLTGKVKELIRDGAYRRFYMHRTGHWLGMDAHDVGTYKVDGAWRYLKAGMVLTVEPGIYIPQGAEGVPEKYWGIGIRIEDDCLVTEGDAEILTAAVAKHPDEIEALMVRKR